MGVKWLGAAVKRKEDPALLTGKGHFVDDIRLPGTRHAAFVRSPHPHARIRGIDTSAARAIPGVHLVLTFADLPQSLRTNSLPLLVPHPAITQAFMPDALASNEASYAGEPLAVVVADSRYIAEDATALVAVDYEPLPAVGDCVAAIEPASPVAHANAPSNIAAQFTVNHGDCHAAFADAAHVFGERIFLHRGGAFFMGCRGMRSRRSLPRWKMRRFEWMRSSAKQEMSAYQPNASRRSVYTSKGGTKHHTVVQRGLNEIPPLILVRS